MGISPALSKAGIVDTTMNSPIALADGLKLCWAKAEDAEALAQFHLRVHNDDVSGSEPGFRSKTWPHDLMSRHHPTTSTGEFTILVDENNGGRTIRLFGYRSLEEICHIRPDCLIESNAKETDVLLKVLFPHTSIADHPS